MELCCDGLEFCVPCTLLQPRCLIYDNQLLLGEVLILRRFGLVYWRFEQYNLRVSARMSHCLNSFSHLNDLRHKLVTRLELSSGMTLYGKLITNITMSNLLWLIYSILFEESY